MRFSGKNCVIWQENWWNKLGGKVFSGVWIFAGVDVDASGEHLADLLQQHFLSFDRLIEVLLFRQVMLVGLFHFPLHTQTHELIRHVDRGIAELQKTRIFEEKSRPKRCETKISQLKFFEI